MKRNLLIAFTAALLISNLTAQSKTDWNRKNATYFDIGGWAFWYSFNYEHRISLAYNHRLGLGGGMMLIPPTKDASLLAGLHVNYLLGKTHNLEIGITPSVFFGEEKEFLFSPRLGYRYEAPGGFLFRAGLSPVSAMMSDPSGNTKRGVIPWGYLSFGYTF
ncbi:MAG: hypothetical protein ACYC2P_06955 [Paludibacteraceae bacterium]